MKKTLITIASLLLLSGAGWSDDLETNAEEAKYYDNAKVVRIKSIEGEGFVQRSYEEGNEEATANLPLFEKDTIGTTEGRLSVYLGRMNYLRLDDDTVVAMEKLPQLRQTDLTVRLETGSIYLAIESLDYEKGIEIQTPDCGIFLLDKGVYRINSGRNGLTEVLVFEGIAEVAGRESSRNVRENQKIVMEHGEMAERPFYFYASKKDGFDRWNEEQESQLGYARYGGSRYLQGGYEDYEYEMSRSGRWSYMSDYRSYVWIPHYADSNWRPYANGRWVWNPYYGYVWTSYDNCGWFTHHYGRWHWDYALGWYWIPSYHWSPAWVSWFWNDHYYGWCPLSWWNRPVVVINNRWDRRYDYHRGIPHHSRSTIIIRKNELAAPNIHRAIVNKNALQNGNDSLAFRGKAPSERLISNKITVNNARGRAVTYKENGIVSNEKYRAQGTDVKSRTYKYGQDGDNRVIAPSHDKTAGTSYRSRNNESTDGNRRARSSANTDNTAGKSGYRSKTESSKESNDSDRAVYRSKSDDSRSTSSDSDNAPARKKKEETSYRSRSGSGYSGEADGRAAQTTRYQSRYANSGGFSYRSHDSNNSSGKAARDNRRYIGGGASSSYRSADRPRSGFDGYSGRSYKTSSSSSSYSRPAKSNTSGRSGTPASASRSSASSRSSSSSSSASSHRASSSSSSGNSGSRSAKKK